SGLYGRPSSRAAQGAIRSRLGAGTGTGNARRGIRLSPAASSPAHLAAGAAGLPLAALALSHPAQDFRLLPEAPPGRLAPGAIALLVQGLVAAFPGLEVRAARLLPKRTVARFEAADKVGVVQVQILHQHWNLL